jgi:hypothetical protein
MFWGRFGLNLSSLPGVYGSAGLPTNGFNYRRRDERRWTGRWLADILQRMQDAYSIIPQIPLRYNLGAEILTLGVRDLGVLERFRNKMMRFWGWKSGEEGGDRT